MRPIRPFVLLLLAALSGCHDQANVEAQSRALSAGFQVGAARSFGTSTSDPAFGEHVYPAVAHGGGVFLALWSSLDNSRVYAVRTRASDGVVLDDRRLLLGSAPFIASAAVDWDGQNFLAVWPDYDSSTSKYKLVGVRVGTDGKLVDPAPIVLRNDLNATQVAMAHGTSEHLVVWRQPASLGSNQYDVRGARFTHDGQLIGSIISLGVLPTPESRPAVAFDGTNYLVVWEDQRGNYPDIYGNRVRASDGALLDGTNGFKISFAVNAQTPAVAFDGTNYLVVFKLNTGALGGVRLRASDGGVIDTMDRTLASASSGTVQPPHLTFDGNHYLMSWGVIGGNLGLQHQGARIDPATGANLDGATGITFGASTGSIDERSGHDVAAGSGRLFAAYTKQDSLNQTVHAAEVVDTRGVFIDPATGAPDGAPVQLSKSARWQEEPDSSSDGQRHLVVWHEWSGSRFEIRGGRVSNQDGTVLDPAGIAIGSSATADQLHPHTASNGTNHLVVWWDGTGLRANRVRASDGAVLDGAGTMLPAQTAAGSVYDPYHEVASDGTDYLVLGSMGTLGGGAVRKVVRVRGSDGAVLDATPREVSSSTTLAFGTRLAFSGSRYVVLWVESIGAGTYQVKVVRLAIDGTVLDPTPIVISNVSGFTKDPAMAGDGENMLVTWIDSALKGRRLRLSDGVVLDSSDLSLIPSISEPSALAFDGSNFVATWSRYLPGDVVARRISKAGTLLDPAPTVVAALPYGAYYGLALSAGADGKALSTYVVYDDAANMQTQRIRSSLLSDPPPPPDAAPPTPDVAPDIAPPSPDVAPPSPDAALLPDAGAPPDAAAPPPPPPDADVPPDSAAALDAPPASPEDASASPGDAAPLPDAAAPNVDLSPDQGAAPDAAGPADAALSPDGAIPPDAATPGDGAISTDVDAPADGTVYTMDSSAASDGPAADAVARDGAVEKPRGGGHGGCAVAPGGRAPIPALVLLVPLLLRRRRR